MNTRVLVFLCCICCLCVKAATDWNTAVEDILSHVAINAINENFNMKTLEARTIESCMERQTRRFRALAVSAILSTIEDETVVCPLESYINDQAMQTVSDELSKNGFKTHMITGECWKDRKGLLIRIPKIKK